MVVNVSSLLDPCVHRTDPAPDLTYLAASVSELMAVSAATGLPPCGPLLALHLEIMARQGRTEQVAMAVYSISPTSMKQLQHRSPGPSTATNVVTAPAVSALLSSLESITSVACLQASNEGGNAVAVEAALGLLHQRLALASPFDRQIPLAMSSLPRPTVPTSSSAAPTKTDDASTNAAAETLVLRLLESGQVRLPNVICSLLL